MSFHSLEVEIRTVHERVTVLVKWAGTGTKAWESRTGFTAQGSRQKHWSELA